jgi:hypothetical protein
MKILLVLIPLLMLTGCFTRVQQGEFGIISHLGGSVADEPAPQGFNMTLLDSITTVDATEVRVPMKDLTPKDKDGVLFTVDLTVTYKVNPEKGIAFYKQTHEVDRVKENDSTNTVLGYRVMEDTVANSISKAFNDFAVSEIGPRRTEIEARLKEIVQQKIDGRYADAFIIVNVNINRTKLGDAVEAVLQSQAIAKSQRVLLELQEQLAGKESDLIQKKIEGLRIVSTKTGVPVEKLMQFKLREQYNNVLSELAKNHNGNTQVQVNNGKEE